MQTDFFGGGIITELLIVGVMKAKSKSMQKELLILND